MTSNDLVIIEVFNNRMNSIEQKIISLQQEIKDTRQEIKDTRNELLTEIKVNQNNTAHLQHSIYWGFALATILITVVIAIIGFIVALAPTIREYFTSKQQKSITEEKVQSMIETAITNALAGKLR